MSQPNAQSELLLKMKQIFKRFQAGGDLAPIRDRYEYDKAMESLPADARAFAEEATQMADMLQYCEQQNLAVPADVTRAMRELPRLPDAERVVRIRELNRDLISHIFDAGEDSAIRQ